MMDRLRHTAAVAAGIFTLAVASAVTACSSDAYDTGDGTLSYMRADFVEAQTDGAARFVKAQTDDGVELTLSPALSAAWAVTPDSMYRALLYYNAEEGMAGDATVRPIAVSSVLVARVTERSRPAAAYPTDPVSLETSWMSKNRTYINLGLRLKTGTADGQVASQTLGAVYTGSEQRDDGTECHRILVVHSQNGAPQYYSAQVYVSIPLRELPFALSAGDDIEIDVNTYSGTVSKTFHVIQHKEK